MTKNQKNLWTVVYCYSPERSCKRVLDEGLTSIFGHIFTKNNIKTETGFYFAFSSLTLQAFAILYINYL